ncbi:MAG: peptide chain release factor aRF-1 [Candidatus Asgardarchaeia archaeon]
MRKINQIKSFKGRHSSLTTLYVPSDKNLVDVINFLRQEYETASNIKDKTNRKMVQDNIQRLINDLQRIRQVPENGLVMFYGYHEVREGQFEEIRHVLEPPLPITQFIYLCGKEFYVKPLVEMTEARSIIGIVLMEAGHYTIGLIKGKRIEVVKDDDYYIVGKTRRGGQSARRYERLREEQVNNFYKHLANIVNEIFLPIIDDVDALVFGGNTIRVQEFLQKPYLDYRLREKILSKVLPVSIVDEMGIYMAVKEISEIVKNSEIAKERDLWENFKSRLSRDDKLITYGKDIVLDYLKQGRVDLIIISETMGGLVDEVIELAEKYGTKVEIFSKDTEPGQELIAFGGIVAILRW